MKEFQLAPTIPNLLKEAFPPIVDPYHPNRVMTASYCPAPMITLELGLLLYSFIRLSKARSIVETGTCHGNSSSWMAAAIKDNGLGGKVTTFDILVEKNPSPQEVWNRIGVNTQIEFVNSAIWDNEEKVPEVIDFAFVDSKHSVEVIQHEMNIIWPRLSSQSIVAFDDHTLYPECREVMESFKPNFIFSSGRGLLLAQKKEKK